MQYVNEFSNKDKISKINEICTDFKYIWQTHGVRCLVSTILIRPSIDEFKQTYLNLSKHNVTYTILQSQPPEKYVNLSKSMQNLIQTYK